MTTAMTFTTIWQRAAAIGAVLFLSFGLISTGQSAETPGKAKDESKSAKTNEVITLGAGCFWCTEAVYQQIPGVISVKPGYMGGTVKNPTYEQVCRGDTMHAEVAQVVFDPAKTSLEKVLAVFWHAHDPTTLNRQGGDTGTQYRSAIFYHTPEQKKIADKSKAAAGKEFSQPIVTEITAAKEFYVAEDYHHNYYRLNKNKNPYCARVIAPKLKKLGLEP